MRSTENVPGPSLRLGCLWGGCDLACLGGTQWSQECWEKAVDKGLAQLWRWGEAVFFGHLSEALGP